MNLKPILPTTHAHPPETTSTSDPITNTRYLDGLRGLAALIVYTHHHTWHAHELENGPAIFSSAFSSNNHYLSVFPIFRLLFSGGPSAVAVFFVISGYALSFKPLTALQSREPQKLLEVVGSGIFRRWSRLFLPVAITTFLWAASWHVLDLMPNLRQESLVQEATKWASNFAQYSFLWKDVVNSYNEHLWAVSFEFRGSMVVFAAIIAFSHLKHVSRVLAEVGLVVYFLWVVDGPYYASFVAGLVICDLDILHKRNEIVDTWLTRAMRKLEPLFRPRPAGCLFLLGLYLGGVPTQKNDIHYLRSSPGWFLLSYLAPSNFAVFFQFWSAVLLVTTIPCLPSVRAFLNSSFCQYLGSISFSLYLLHGPIMYSLGDRLYALVGRVSASEVNVPSHWHRAAPVKRTGCFGFELDFIAVQSILLPCTILGAHICTRLVDRKVDKFSRWLLRQGAIDRRR